VGHHLIERSLYGCCEKEGQKEGQEKSCKEKSQEKGRKEKEKIITFWFFILENAVPFGAAFPFLASALKRRFLDA